MLIPPQFRVRDPEGSSTYRPQNTGMRQGCPLSPLLFLVITEALTRLIQNDRQIEGIKINGTHHKISQYADDSTLFATKGDVPSAQVQRPPRHLLRSHMRERKQDQTRGHAWGTVGPFPPPSATWGSPR